MWSDRSTREPACPFCRRALEGWADLATSSGAVRVHACAVCGRYAITAEVAPLIGLMSEATRLCILANLEVRA
jgi:hypothetical protein